MGNKFSTKQVLIATTFFQSVSATTSLKSPLTTRFYNSAWDPAGTPLRSSVLKFMEKKLFISNSLKSSSGSRSQAKLFPISISKKKKDQIFTFLFFSRKKPGGGSWRRKNSSYWDFELIDAQMRWSMCECVCTSVRVCECACVLLLWVCEWEWVGNRNLFEDMNWAKGEMFCVEGNPEKLRNFYFSSFFPSMDKFLFLGWESLIWNWFSFHLSFQ